MYIQRNLFDYLFIQFPCPKCEQQASLSLNSLLRMQEVLCPTCKTKMAFVLPRDYLQNFYKAYEQLQLQLNKIGLPLFFVSEEEQKKAME